VTDVTTDGLRSSREVDNRPRQRRYSILTCDGDQYLATVIIPNPDADVIN